MTWEQLEEIIEDALCKHISRDASVPSVDRDWETANFTITVAKKLRVNGVAFIPSPDFTSALEGEG